MTHSERCMVLFEFRTNKEKPNLLKIKGNFNADLIQNIYLLSRTHREQCLHFIYSSGQTLQYSPTENALDTVECGLLDK